FATTTPSQTAPRSSLHASPYRRAVRRVHPVPGFRIVRQSRHTDRKRRQRHCSSRTAREQSAEKHVLRRKGTPIYRWIWVFLRSSNRLEIRGATKHPQPPKP